MDQPQPRTGDRVKSEEKLDIHGFVLIRVKWLKEIVNVLNRVLITTVGTPKVYCQGITVALLVVTTLKQT